MLVAILILILISPILIIPLGLIPNLRKPKPTA